METYIRSKPNDFRWLITLGAAAGTLLLVLVSAWNPRPELPGATLMFLMIKALLTLVVLTVVPSLWARSAAVVSPWILLGLAALSFGCGMLVFRDAKTAGYAALLCTLPGVGLFALQKLGISNFRTVLYGSFVILAALYCRFCLPGLLETGDGYAWFRNAVTLLGKSIEPTGLLEASFAGVKLSDVIELYRDSAEAICISAMLAGAMAASLSNTLLSHLYNRNGGAALTPLPRFAQWRCERWYVILSAVLAIGTYLLGMFGWETASALFSAADVLWRLPCMLAGLCAVRDIGLHMGRGWIVWIALGMLVMLPSVGGILLVVIGMLASLRKPLNTGKNGGQI